MDSLMHYAHSRQRYLKYAEKYRVLTDPEIVMETYQKSLDETITYVGNVMNSMGQYIQAVEVNSDKYISGTFTYCFAYICPVYSADNIHLFFRVTVI